MDSLHNDPKGLICGYLSYLESRCSLILLKFDQYLIDNFCSITSNNLVKTYHPNSQLRTLALYRDGRKNGRSTTYYKDCRLESSIHYINDKKHGKCEFYYPNGQLEFLIHYSDNNRHGKYKEYYSNGQLKLFVHYRDNKRQGECKEYYSNGQLYNYKFYDNGKMVGEYKEFYENCQLHKYILFDKYNDLSEYKKYKQDGKIYKNVFYGKKEWLMETNNNEIHLKLLYIETSFKILYDEGNVISIKFQIKPHCTEIHIKISYDTKIGLQITYNKDNSVIHNYTIDNLNKFIKRLKKYDYDFERCVIEQIEALTENVSIRNYIGLK